jgi:hypothetical protein
MPAGCAVRLNDGWYVNQNQETVSGTALADGQTRYVYLSASTLSAAMTSTAPSWNQIKRGYYSGNDRALAKVQAVVQDTSTAYFIFWLYKDGDNDSGVLFDKKLTAGTVWRKIIDQRTHGMGLAYSMATTFRITICGGGGGGGQGGGGGGLGGGAVLDMEQAAAAAEVKGAQPAQRGLTVKMGVQVLKAATAAQGAGALAA